MKIEFSTTKIWSRTLRKLRVQSAIEDIPMSRLVDIMINDRMKKITYGKDKEINTKGDD